MIYKCTHFGIKELVSPIVYDKWGEQSWMFFSPDVLKDLDEIRESWGSPIIINNWKANLKQCGLRSNMDEIVLSKKGQLYLSAHTMGCGFDLHDSLGRNSKLFEHVYSLILRKKLKCFRRLENFKNTPTWVHTDTFQSNNIVF